MKYVWRVITLAFLSLIFACVYWFFADGGMMTQVEAFFVTLVLCGCPVITGILSLGDEK
jgi:hypothetical protein